MRRLPWLVVLMASLLLVPFLNAQSGLGAPAAADRDEALSKMTTTEETAYWREILDSKHSAAFIIEGLLYLQVYHQTEDVARIAGFVGDIDPFISSAAATALRSFGRRAISEIDSIPNDKLDKSIRKKLLKTLLRDHIRKCCSRDMSVNPFHFDYEGRFAELYSIKHDLTDLMFDLVTSVRTEIIDDIDGRNNYGWNRNEFLYYGGLAVAALAKSHPDRLAKVLEEVKDMKFQTRRWWWGSSTRSIVSTEAAIFFAKQGEPRLIEKMISDMQKSFRNQRNSAYVASIHLQIAVLEYVALGDASMALERIDESKNDFPSSKSSATSMVYYLRARLLMELGEDGAALHDLEESMEASDSTIVLLAIDTAFSALKGERRFQTILDFVELKTRRLSKDTRPWIAEEDTEDDE